MTSDLPPPEGPNSDVDPTDEPEDRSDATADAATNGSAVGGPRRRLLIAAAVALVLVLAGATTLVLRNPDSASVADARTTTSVSTTTKRRAPTTTTTAAPMVTGIADIPRPVGPPPPRGQWKPAEVATVRTTEIVVSAAGPAGAPAAPAPRGSGLGAIPRDGFSSAGTWKTPDGWGYSNPTYFGHPLTFLVTARAGDQLRVAVPARPNGIEGWIPAADVKVTTNNFLVRLDLSERRLTAYDGDQPIADTLTVIGLNNTYTPLGRFYLADTTGGPGAAYGPWVLATNAYSESLDSFDGGLPVVALHGTNNPFAVGTQRSNGCVRMPNDIITFLHDTLPLGTPIEVVA